MQIFERFAFLLVNFLSSNAIFKVSNQKASVKALFIFEFLKIFAIKAEKTGLLAAFSPSEEICTKVTKAVVFKFPF